MSCFALTVTKFLKEVVYACQRSTNFATSSEIGCCKGNCMQIQWGFLMMDTVARLEVRVCKHSWVEHWHRNRHHVIVSLNKKQQYFFLQLHLPFIQNTFIHVILLDSLNYAKSSLIWDFSRRFSVPCAPSSMLPVPPISFC